MKKLMMLAALLALLTVAAIPAIAQVTQEAEQEGESAELNQEASTTQEGDNSIQCVNDQLTGNTGNAQTLNQGLAYASESASPSGNAEITLTPKSTRPHRLPAKRSRHTRGERSIQSSPLRKGGRGDQSPGPLCVVASSP